MALGKRNLSWQSKFNIFANSPRFVKLFGPLLILLVVGALGYGGYTLLKENSSDAATTDNNTWYYNSAGIGHHAGQKGTSLSKSVWVATNSNRDRGQLVWWGPYKHLEPGRQYIGCFFYRFGSYGYDRAEVDVVNTIDGRQTMLHKYTVKKSQPGNDGQSFRRTCLAFYIPSSMKRNAIELRIKHGNGSLYIRKTKISRIPRDTSELSNQWIFKPEPDNETVTHNYGYKE